MYRLCNKYIRYSLNHTIYIETPENIQNKINFDKINDISDSSDSEKLLQTLYILS